MPRWTPHSEQLSLHTTPHRTAASSPPRGVSPHLLPPLTPLVPALLLFPSRDDAVHPLISHLPLLRLVVWGRPLPPPLPLPLPLPP